MMKNQCIKSLGRHTRVIMPEITLPEAYKVAIIESEAGWGSKIDEIKYFPTEQEARSFVKDYNSLNTSQVTPSWYMFAEYVGKVK
jgi:hypothetical protein